MATQPAINNSNNKPWWQSKTKVGLLISGAFAIVAIIAPKIPVLSSWSSIIGSVGVVVGGIIFGWGVRDTPFINGQ